MLTAALTMKEAVVRSRVMLSRSSQTWAGPAIAWAILCSCILSPVWAEADTDAAAAADATESTAATLTWRIVELGYECEAGVSNEQAHSGEQALRIKTWSKDPAAWFAFVRVELVREDRQPLGTLGQLTEGGSLTASFYRHPDSAEPMPPYTLPWAALRVRTPEGEECVLLWESVYNGYPTRSTVPEDRWITNVEIAAGTFWPRYQNRNYNFAPGFQKLNKWVEGFVTTSRGLSSLQLGPDTQVMAVEFGSGANLPGLLIAYVDDVTLRFANGATYTCGFEAR